MVGWLHGTSIIIDGQRVSITVSIGIATMNVEDESPEQGLLLAEKGLSAARLAGGNQTAMTENAAMS